MTQPLYQQIAEDLRGQIESGRLAPGAPLPTELELREHYAASRNTIRDAVKRLTRLGLVVTRPGQGTFVLARIIPYVTTLTGDPQDPVDDSAFAYLSEVDYAGRRGVVTAPRIEIHTASSDVALWLRVVPGTQLVIRHQERYIDNIPWSLHTTSYPMRFVTDGATSLLMAEDMPGGVIRYLDEVLSIRQTSYRDWITARLPDASEQTFFRIPGDAIVFHTCRTGFDQAGTPMRVSITVYPADRNQFLVEVGDPPSVVYDVPAGADDPPP